MVVVGLLIFSILSWRWVLHPARTDRWIDEPADAVVMFGGAGPRFQLAVALVEGGVSDTLVVSNPNDPDPQGYTAFGVFCAGPHDYETICFDPEPRTTRGESRFVAELAEARRWDRVVIVTTEDQASRARLLTERCWDGDVDVAVVDTDLNRAGRVVYEWGATARALLLRRSC